METIRVASASMPDYSFYLNGLHTCAILLWIHSPAQGILPLKVAYVTLLMAFFLIA